jgi:hypothetical protein
VNVNVEEIRDKARALVRESVALGKKAQRATEQARKLSNDARLIREKSLARLERKRLRA